MRCEDFVKLLKDSGFELSVRARESSGPKKIKGGKKNER